MNASSVFLTLALSFLSGIVYASLGLQFFYTLVPAAVLFIALYALRVDVRVAAVACLLMLLGSGYFVWDNARYEAAIARVPQGDVEGVVTSDPKHEADYQSFLLSTDFGVVSVVAKPESAYFYGEKLSLTASIAPPASAYDKSKHVVGDVKNPAVEVRGEDAGNPVIAFLYQAKHTIKKWYQSVLSPERASFLYGIIFGSSEGFSKQLLSDLQMSGLRFITAIDGLHMQIVILIILAILGSFLTPRIAFGVTGILAFGFVALTGFTVSGIRAALMALIAGFAKHSGRIYTPSNALALVACVLALFNPNVLIFDVGFQLSFLAVLGILYLMPALRWLLRCGEEPGFLAWKESLLITLSVQLATAPIIIGQFQSFSLTSFFASVLVVWLLPLLIAGGFLLAFLVPLLKPLAILLAAIITPGLDYIGFIAHLFTVYAFPLNPHIGFFVVTIYYIVIITFALWFHEQLPKASLKETTASRVPKSGYTIVEIQ